MGVISGTAYPTGFTIVGWEVDDDTRGRVFAFFQSTIQAILLAVIAVAGFIATGLSAAISALNGTKGGVGHDRAHHLRLARRQPAPAAVGGAGRVRRHQGLPAARRPQGRAAADRPGRGVPQRAARVGARRGRGRRARRRVPLPGAVHRVRGRRGRGQDDPVPGDRDLAPRAGLRRGDLARAGRDQDRDAAAGAAARHRPHRHVVAGRGAALRGRPGRARGQGDRPGPDARRDRDHRPVHRLLARLPGRRPRHPDGRHRPAEQLGDRRAAARPHDPARHGPGGGVQSARPVGRPDGVRAGRVPPPGRHGFLTLARPTPSGTWCSTRPRPRTWSPS